MDQVGPPALLLARQDGVTRSPDSGMYTLTANLLHSEKKGQRVIENIISLSWKPK